MYKYFKFKKRLLSPWFLDPGSGNRIYQPRTPGNGKLAQDNVKKIAMKKLPVKLFYSKGNT